MTLHQGDGRDHAVLVGPQALGEVLTLLVVTRAHAGVDQLLYYHIVPPLLVAPMETIFLEGVDDVYDGPVTVGRDGTLVIMESGSEAIEVEEKL